MTTYRIEYMGSTTTMSIDLEFDAIDAAMRYAKNLLRETKDEVVIRNETGGVIWAGFLE